VVVGPVVVENSEPFGVGIFCCQKEKSVEPSCEVAGLCSKSARIFDDIVRVLNVGPIVCGNDIAVLKKPIILYFEPFISLSELVGLRN
jgi:hypothetical protein